MSPEEEEILRGSIVQLKNHMNRTVQMFDEEVRPRFNVIRTFLVILGIGQLAQWILLAILWIK